ncbi:DUF6064 family protein [Tabrizicola sp.]|uniref:DUF6064 family protein n=1 Tax=Tabrizicola sp. TaxID=2005166 RepID=UPI00273752E7|nr:DUF6064 family protein [Tabrizicola sp.]MDP3197292.1 DUF6064 family protein [Tabrizicola sp.]
MPFTTEQFFEVFARYNQAIFPWQIIAVLAGVLAVVLLWQDTRQATSGVLVVLAAMWLLNGIGYHWLHFAPINPVARLFAAAFVAQALLLIWAALDRPALRLTPGRGLVSILGLACIGFAILIYPALGWLAGHRYPAVPMFGVAPCPTTIFTVGVLLQGQWREVRWLLVIPGLWAAIGGSASVLLGVPQDMALVATLGLLVVVAWGHWRGWGDLAT